MATLRIYYLGGMHIPIGSEQNFKITSGQEIFSCPPVGEYIEVPDYVGRDMMSKYGSNVFTTSFELARQVAAGKITFDREEMQGRAIIKEILSEDEVLAKADEIRERRAQESADIETASEEVETETEVETEVETEEPKKAKVRRTRSKKTIVEE